MPRKPAERSNPYFIFLRRLRAGGRSNMYGAIPYLIAAFGCDRNEAFRIVCEWLDSQTPSDVADGPPEPAGTTGVAARSDVADGSRRAPQGQKRTVRRNGRKPSRHKAA
jgi:hypothetical protein